MDVLWEKGAATVAEVAEALPKDLNLAYNTVLTTMRILENKGYVKHRKPKQGRAFVYRPAVTREHASRSALRYLLDRFLRGIAEEPVEQIAQRAAAGVLPGHGRSALRYLLDRFFRNSAE